MKLLLSPDGSPLHGAIVNLGKTIKPAVDSGAANWLYTLLQQVLREHFGIWLADLLRPEVQEEETVMEVEGEEGIAASSPAFGLSPKLATMVSLMEMDAAINVLGGIPDAVKVILQVHAVTIFKPTPGTMKRDVNLTVLES